ncbi:Coiled-coil domain-containing protein 39 [Phlyctochytrium bullatum]|nr:Coiled-coil domain-containing protein 39 [Phlyctochytrium bullatum]
MTDLGQVRDECMELLTAARHSLADRPALLAKVKERTMGRDGPGPAQPNSNVLRQLLRTLLSFVSDKRSEVRMMIVEMMEVGVCKVELPLEASYYARLGAKPNEINDRARREGNLKRGRGYPGSDPKRFKPDGDYGAPTGAGFGSGSQPSTALDNFDVSTIPLPLVTELVVQTIAALPRTSWDEVALHALARITGQPLPSATAPAPSRPTARRRDPRLRGTAATATADHPVPPTLPSSGVSVQPPVQPLGHPPLPDTLVAAMHAGIPPGVAAAAAAAGIPVELLAATMMNGSGIPGMSAIDGTQQGLVKSEEGVTATMSTSMAAGATAHESVLSAAQAQVAPPAEDLFNAMTVELPTYEGTDGLAVAKEAIERILWMEDEFSLPTSTGYNDGSNRKGAAGPGGVASAVGVEGAGSAEKGLSAYVPGEEQLNGTDTMPCARAGWILVVLRLITTYPEDMQLDGENDKDSLTGKVIDYILEDFRNRQELAVLWLYEEARLLVNLSEQPDLSDPFGDWSRYSKLFMKFLRGLRGPPRGQEERLPGLDPKDRTFTRFLVDVPHVPTEAIDVVREYCEDPETIFNEFSSLRPEVATFTLTHIEPLIKSIASNAFDHLLSLIQNLASGADLLGLKILKILCAAGKSENELVSAVVKVVTEKNLSGEFLLPILNQLKKDDFLFHLPRLLALLSDGELQKTGDTPEDIIVQTITPPSQNLVVADTRTPPVTPAEFMVAIHNLEKSAGIKLCFKAVKMCFNYPEVFKQEVLGMVIQRLLDQPSTPYLFMKTVIESVKIYPQLTGFTVSVLTRLVQKKLIAPDSFPILIGLPQRQIEHVLEKKPDLKPKLAEYIASLPPQRASRLKHVVNLLAPPPPPELGHSGGAYNGERDGGSRGDRDRERGEKDRDRDQFGDKPKFVNMLSFDDNLHLHSLPPFANEQNKELSRQTALSAVLALLDDNSTRADAMTAHLKNVQQEIMHTQGIFDAKTRQIETEDHFKQLAERESGRLALEIKSIEKEIAEITDHLNTIQNNIYKGNERIESIRTELKLEKEELDEWLRVQAEKEEDNFALLKYTKEDDMRIKELNLAMHKLMVEVNKKKTILSAEVTETQVAQIELDKTTEEFKKLHMERQELIMQWENALKTMQKRDLDITEAQARYQKSKEDIREKQSVIDEKQAFLDNQLQNNSELEKKIGVLDRAVSKHRSELTSQELQNKRNEIQNLKTDLKEKQQRLEKEKSKKEALKDKLAKVTGETMTLEAKAHELQEILKAEEYRSKEMDRDLKIIREQHFKKSQELFKLKQEEKNLQAEITGGEAALKNLKSTIHRLDQETLKQQALLYAQEFQIQQLERKVRRAQGDRTDEEKEQLLKRIEELNVELENQTKKFTLLNNQLKKSQEDLRQVQLQLALEERTKEIAIHNDMLRLQTKNAEEERQSACAELRERVGRVEKLRRRYEILMTQFAPEEGEEEHSQAFYVIRAAQEKEALQREGDELDAKIRKAEKEIKALENTLKLMNDRNENYRMNLYKAELNATDVQHKEMLEQTAMEKYKAKRNEIQYMQQSLQEMEKALSSISADESQRTQAIAVIENKIQTMSKELKEQESKRERAIKSVSKVSKELKKTSSEAVIDELDFKIRQCKDLGNVVLTELTKVMEQYPEIVNRVTQLYTEV